MATTPRSETQDACPYCHGKLSLIVSRDPDEEVDCVCTDQREVTEVTVEIVIDTSRLEEVLRRV